VTRNVHSFAQHGLFAVTLAGAGLCASAAHAHINLDTEGTHMSRYGESDIKTAPCGRANGARGTNVYTYKPGATITITINEYVAHPGYFRIAFDQDGDDGFADPATITGEHGSCAGDPKCGPGMEDFCNNDTVLLDNLDPHPSAGFGNTPSYTWSVTLPNVECANCTLQIIQVMTDLNIHFAAYPSDDIYYQCIDLVLSNAATEEGDTPMMNDAIDCKAGAPTAGSGGVGGDGGASGAAGAAGEAGMMAATGGMMGVPTGGTGGMPATGGVGGTAGTAAQPAGEGGVSGAAGAAGAMAGAAGIGMMVGTGGSAPVTSSSESSGCTVANIGARTVGLPGVLGWLALSLLLARRRKLVRA
jgi:hypothetical protein